MKMNVFQVLAIASTLCLSILVGCSNNSSVISNTAWPESPSSVKFWFPVQSGYSTTFEEIEAGGTSKTTQLTIGGQVDFAGGKATEWFLSNGSGVYDTSYFVATDTAVYVYENLSAAPERVLLMPLVPGASWKRYPGYDDTGRDTISIITGGTDPGDTLPPSGGGVMKVFPTVGSNLMKVERSEDIVLRDGTSYTGTLKIVNTNADGTENRYWFAAGFGLVKYTVSTSSARPDGTAWGELISFVR